MEKPNSEILRDLVTNYAKSLPKTHEKKSIPQVYHSFKEYDYKTISKRVDELLDQKKQFFNDSNKKGGFD